MGVLKKATISQVYDKKTGPPPPGAQTDPLEVQFNPTTLKLQYTNESTGGATTKGPNRQNPAQGNAVLSLDLEYDTAEGDDDGNPVDVREKTKHIIALVRPPKGSKGAPPPRIKFVWGKLTFEGNVTSLTEDIDYFDDQGRALRCKLSLSIKEQDLSLLLSPADADADNATKPGQTAANGAPGSGPTKNPVKTAPANAGESVQQALTRLNADPATWRTAMAGLTSPLALSAGAQLQLGADVSAGAGLSGGVDAIGSVDATGAVGASAELSAGFSLSAAGGISQAVNVQASAEAEAGVVRARASFAVPASPAVSAGASLDLDRRAQTYGWSVPLKPPVRIWTA
jgi:Contractile injection system tube protein